MKVEMVFLLRVSPHVESKKTMEAAASPLAQEALQHPTDTSNIYSLLDTEP